MHDRSPFLLDHRDATRHAPYISQFIEHNTFGNRIQRTLRGLEASIGGLS